MTVIASGSSAVVTVTSNQQIAINSAPGVRCDIEATSGVPGSATKRKLALHSGGFGVYGPFGVGTVTLFAIGGSVDYDATNPLNSADEFISLTASETASVRTGAGRIVKADLGTNQVADAYIPALYVAPPVAGAQVLATQTVSSGFNQINLVTAGIFSGISAEDCSTLSAYMPGVGTIPVEVAPGASKAGSTATLYVNAPASGELWLLDSYDRAFDAARTVAPESASPLNTTASLSASHSLAGGVNPITSFVHPSAVYIPGGWNGATYWLTVTPWAGVGFPSADRYEDGMLFTSSDLSTFTAVNVNASGFANLSAAYSEGSAASTDTRLVFDPAGNGGAGILYAYFRYTVAGDEIIYRIQSTNGTTWTNAAGTTGAKDACTFNGATSPQTGFPSLPVVTTCLSPSVCKVGPDWHMWATSYASSYTGSLQMRHWRSRDGLSFTGGRLLPSPFGASYQGIWHSDVQWDEDSRQWVILAQVQRTSARGVRGSTFASINILGASTDGENFFFHPVPVAQSGQDQPTATTHIYKGALLRTGVRTWRVFNSYGLLTNGDKRTAVSAAYTIEFDRLRATRPVCGVFLEPVGRWFGNSASITAPGVIHREPTWSAISSSGTFTAQIVNGALRLLRGSGAGQANSGARFPLTYSLRARFKQTHTTSIVRIGDEGGEQVGLIVSASTFKLNNVADPGVSFTADTSMHDWELRRSWVSPSDAGSISTTATTNGTRTIVVASSTNMAVGESLTVAGAGAQGGLFESKISSIAGTNVVVEDTPPTNVTSQACRVSRYRLEGFRDGVKLHETYSSDIIYGQMKLFCSGSASGQGAEFECIYLLPVDTPLIQL